MSKGSVKLFSSQTRGIILSVKSNLGPQITQSLHYTSFISSKYPLNLLAGLGNPSHLFSTWWNFHLGKALCVNSRSSSTVSSTRPWSFQFLIASQSLLKESQLWQTIHIIFLKWWLLYGLWVKKKRRIPGLDYILEFIFPCFIGRSVLKITIWLLVTRIIHKT